MPQAVTTPAFTGVTPMPPSAHVVPMVTAQQMQPFMIEIQQNLRQEMDEALQIRDLEIARINEALRSRDVEIGRLKGHVESLEAIQEKQTNMFNQVFRQLGESDARAKSKSSFEQRHNERINQQLTQTSTSWTTQEKVVTFVEEDPDQALLAVSTGITGETARLREELRILRSENERVQKESLESKERLNTLAKLSFMKPGQFVWDHVADKSRGVNLLRKKKDAM